MNIETACYRIKVASLAAVDLSFSAENQVLVVSNPVQRRGYNPEVKIKIYEQANILIDLLAQGITNKRQLANLCGSNIDGIYRILRLLWQNGKIENYRFDRHNVIPRNLEAFDLRILRFGIAWKKIKDIKVGDYIVP